MTQHSSATGTDSLPTPSEVGVGVIFLFFFPNTPMKIQIAKFSKQTQPINPDGAPHGSATGKPSGVAKGSAPGGEQQQGLRISSGQEAAPRKRRKDRRCRAPAACYQKEIGRESRGRSCKFTRTLEQCFIHVKPWNFKRPQRHFCNEPVHNLSLSLSLSVDVEAGTSSLHCGAMLFLLPLDGGEVPAPRWRVQTMISYGKGITGTAGGGLLCEKQKLKLALV